MGVKVGDGVIRSDVLKLEACLAVIVSREALILVVGGVAGVDAGGAVDQPTIIV